jgi:sodium-dependent dicarboxylate transporter 2/3/5
MTREGPSNPVVQWTGLVAAPVLAVGLYFLLPAMGGQDLTHGGRATLAAIVLMSVWWLTEALPIEATALVPLVLFPVLGIADIKKASAPYADDVIYLFLGGMLLGAAMERWNLHRRFALMTIFAVGTRPDRLIAGIMIAAAAISMWVSNTATAVMMLPIGVSIINTVGHRVHGKRGLFGSAQGNFAKAMMLGIAYAATVGGIGTVVGTPPNTVAKAFIERTYGVTLSFADWFKIGVPIMLIFLPATWLILVKVVYPVHSGALEGVHEAIGKELKTLGRPGRGEVLTLVVFVCTAVAWVFSRQLGGLLSAAVGREIVIADSSIAIACGLALFMLPVNARKREFLLDWETAGKVPWGVLLLFGGGLSLAAAVSANHVDVFIGSLFSGVHVHPLALVLIVTTVVVFATEVGSNTAIVNIFLPIVAPVAVKLGVHPYLLIFPVAIGASYAYMMPTGTPPNALVFASGHLRVADMARPGFLLNLVSISLITVYVYFAAPVALKFERAGSLPAATSK